MKLKILMDAKRLNTYRARKERGKNGKNYHYRPNAFVQTGYIVVLHLIVRRFMCTFLAKPSQF
jgi:hypothetical protein